MTGSLRARLVIGVAIGLAIALIVVGVVVDVLARRALTAQLDDALAAKARALAVLVEDDHGQIDTDLGRTLMPEFAEGARAQYFELWLDDGQVVARSASLGARDLAGLSRGELSLRDVRLPDGRRGRQATLHFSPRREDDDDGDGDADGDADGDRGAPAARHTATLAVARDVAEVDAGVARLRSVLAVGGAVAIVVCLALLAWLARFGLAPVNQLAARIAAIDPHKLDARFDPAQVPAELRPVVERLDGLMQRLAAAFDRERELTAEVAHELRTPLAGIKATLELALARERAPAAYRAAIADSVAICDQMARLVETLLVLARLDAGGAPVIRDSLSLDTLVAEVADAHAARFAARHLTVSRAIAPCAMAGDRERLRIVIHNLLDNAATHADDGGTVRIELTSGDVATVTIANTGSTVTAAESAHVFDRFWRGDLSRAPGDHFGLGLALCKKLVDHMGGTITARSTPGGEFIVELRLPA